MRTVSRACLEAAGSFGRQRSRARAGLRTAALISIFAASALSGCSGGTDLGVSTLIVDPARFSAYHCNQLATKSKELQVREQDLRNLMDKAGESGAGTVVAVMAYRSDYEKTLGEEKLIQREANEKKCAFISPPVSDSDKVIR